MWNDKKLADLCSELGQACIENGFDLDDSMAFDIADGVLATEDGLEDYLRNVKNIQDPVGYIANCM